MSALDQRHADAEAALWIGDLIERMTRAADRLDEMAEVTTAAHATRLRGKAEGVRLALSYVREVQR